MYNKKDQEGDISFCCEQNNSKFFPIENNIFAITDLTPEKKTIGQESGSEESGIKNEKFVKVYQCLKKIGERKIFFKNKNPYEGIILDNRFFLNVILYCRRKSFLIQEIDYQTEMGTNDVARNAERINEVIKEIENKEDLRIVKLVANIFSTRVFLNKRGYVEVAHPEPKIIPEIIEMIKIGFENDVIN